MRVVLLALAHLAFFSTSAFAQDWQAREVAGAVRVMIPGQPARTVSTNDVLPQGAVVTTGRDGRAVFSDGSARFTMSANSRITLAPSTDAFTRFLQDLGSVAFQVDRRGEPHFEVRTSLLAAVVKGTTFTVSVDAQEHLVFVAEGAVEVTPAAGGETALVHGGAMAEVMRNDPTIVQTPQVASGSAPSTVAPLDYAALSGGLVGNGERENAPPSPVTGDDHPPVNDLDHQSDDHAAPTQTAAAGEDDPAVDQGDGATGDDPADDSGDADTSDDNGGDDATDDSGSGDEVSDDDSDDDNGHGWNHGHGNGNGDEDEDEDDNEDGDHSGHG